ncbi:MAG: response regulator transcription factor [Gammaproteobacteria bacterium]|nr:response regulator transcription factor [Gammaproteobacteria bacterium]
MNRYNFELTNNSHALQVMQKSGADGVSLFLLDNSLENHPISFIYHKHLSEETLERYASSLYKHDPLTPHRKSVLHSCSSFTGISVDNTATSDGDPDSPNGQQYWKYFKRLGFHETAVSFRAISSNMYLVIGLNLTVKRKHLSVDPAIQSMDSWLKESCDYVIEFSVRNYNRECFHKKPEPQLEDLAEHLTNREFQVVCELLQGKSNKQIAYTLSLSEYTIENYLRKIYRKFNVRSRTSLMALLKLRDFSTHSFHGTGN